MTEPTYDELRAEREREWSAAQSRAAAELRETQRQLQAMPEIQKPASPWDTHGAIPCHCEGSVYQVIHWVTVNGARHRAGLLCLGCRHFGTWDFGEARWIG